MIVSLDDVNAQLAADRVKLENLVALKASAPVEFSNNTDHFANFTTLYPYIYHKVLVKKYLEPGSSILDWGAYLGQVTYLLQDDFDVTAYNPVEQADINYWHTQLAIKKPVFDCGIFNGELRFDQPFDGVISSGVLEHTFEFGQTDVEALRNLYKILKNDGYLFIWHLPTSLALAELLAKAKHAWKHTLRYSLDEVLVKLNLTGFDIVAIETNDLAFSKIKKALSFLDLASAWSLDHTLANLPILKLFSHHFTIVAKKVPGFPRNPANSGYTTYI